MQAKSAKKKGPKFTLNERSILKARVIQLYIRDFTQTQIAEMTGVSQQQISIWIQEIVHDWQQQTIEGRDQLIAQKRAQYAEVRREAWAEWERSKLETNRRLEASGTKGETGWTKSEIVTEHRLAAKAYIDAILDTYRQERSMLGLDVEPKQAGVNVNIGMNWNNILIEAQQEKDPIAALEMRINALAPEEVATLPPITADEVLAEELMK